MPTTIKVSIAKLGTSIQEVEVEVGSTAMQALRKAGFNLDSVVSIKRNGAVVALDTVLDNQDVLLVSQEKIKGGADEVTAEPNILKLSFTIEKENQTQPNNQMIFTDDMSTFDIVKAVMQSRGVSLNNFKEIRDSEGEVITFADKLEDGEAYKLIICAEQNCGACDEDEDDNY